LEERSESCWDFKRFDEGYLAIFTKNM
jgi:hypothetical protein